MKYLVTGATGLLGNNIVRRLLEEGEQVRVLSRAASDKRPFAGLDVEQQTGDLTDVASIQKAVEGVDVVIHSAGHVQIGWSQVKEHQSANVEGAKNVAGATRVAGARLVHVSTVNALGLGRLDNPATEETALPGAILCPYVVTKRAGEEAVQKEIELGLSAVMVHPGFMLGPWDWKPSSGKMLLEVARFAPLAPTGAFSVADARDVAAAIVTAAKSPSALGNYILGGHNLTYMDSWKKFAAAAGRRGPRFRAGPFNRWVGALAGDLWGRITSREPNLNTAGMRMSCQHHCFSSAKAEHELGYRNRPLDVTIADAWNWFVKNGYVK
ncbi:MAG: NAD-dependent epimerase/dehydratase family protein [Pirellulaceae bacterium]|nr:NAD-dependent epimerase/dehydratase family protein [Pirellulaceae bacterium]